MNIYAFGFAAAAGLAAFGVWVTHPESRPVRVSWEQAIFTLMPGAAGRRPQNQTQISLPAVAGEGHRPLWQVTHGGLHPTRDYVSQIQDRAHSDATAQRKARAICVRRGTSLDCG